MTSSPLSSYLNFDLDNLFTKKSPTGSIYRTIMEVGLEKPGKDGLLGSNSIMVPHMEPLGVLQFRVEVNPKPVGMKPGAELPSCRFECELMRAVKF